MRIGASMFLIAVGAIMRFAVTPHYSHGVNWGTIGVILMIVGVAGALLTVALLTTRRRTEVTVRGERPRTYVEPGSVQSRSTTYVERGPVDPGAI